LFFGIDKIFILAYHNNGEVAGSSYASEQLQREQGRVPVYNLITLYKYGGAHIAQSETKGSPGIICLAGSSFLKGANTQKDREIP
jgi:hypothetical protein